MHTSNGRLNVPCTSALFHFQLIKKPKQTKNQNAKALYLTSNSPYISHCIRLQEEEKSLKMFQKITLAPEITKLTLKGEKCEPIHAFPLLLPYRKSKKLLQVGCQI